MGAECLPSGVRQVLAAPRGQRFTRARTGKSTGRPPTRQQQQQQQLLTQLAENPRVSYRQAHGQLPAWMHLHAARLAVRQPQRKTQTPEAEEPREPVVVPDRSPVPLVPRPRPAPDDGPLPPPPTRERPPLPRRPRHPRPDSTTRADGDRSSGTKAGAEIDPRATITRAGASYPRHRRPRRRSLPGPLWLLAAYTLASGAAAMASTLANHLTPQL